MMEWWKTTKKCSFWVLVGIIVVIEHVVVVESFCRSGSFLVTDGRIMKGSSSWWAVQEYSEHVGTIIVSKQHLLLNWFCQGRKPCRANLG